MSSQETPHLRDEDLVRLLDGELKERDAALLESHLDACWTCRTRKEEFESSIGEYVRYREAVLKPILPPPPQTWNDLRPEFEKADRQLEADRIAPLVRRKHRFGFRPAYWIAVAACLILGLILIGRFEYAPSVRAAELLGKASAAELTAAPGRRIQVKSRRRTLIRPAVLTSSSASEGVPLKQIFDAARFSWGEPLSARSYSAWHDQLLEKRDQVSIIDQDESAGVPVYVIRTSTVTSTLRRATLTLRTRDLRPMREMLEFASDTVEITEMPESGSSAAEEAAAPPASGRTNTPLHATEPRQSTPTVRLVLEVFAALHRIGADLGEPVAMHKSGSQLLIVGTGLTSNQKDQLTEALAGISGVQVIFENATANPGGRSTPADRAAPATPAMQARLQALLGSRDSAEDFTNRALDASDAVMARVHALRALARAFPPDVERGLTISDRDMLATLRNDHVSALSQHIAELRQILQLAIPLPVAPPVVEASPSWQSSVETLFTAAQQLDDLLNTALASPKGDAAAFGKLRPALERLQSRLAGLENVDR